MFEICIDRKVIYDFQGALDDSCCENTTCMQLILIMQWLPSIHILPISNIYSLDNRPPFQRYLSLLSFWIQRIIIWLSPASRSISAWEISFIQMKPLDHFMFRPWGERFLPLTVRQLQRLRGPIFYWERERAVELCLQQQRNKVCQSIMGNVATATAAAAAAAVPY